MNYIAVKSVRQGGYTLIELLLYVAVIGALLTSITYFFGMAVDTRVKNQSIAQVNEQGAAAMSYMLQTIRNANSITNPIAASSGNSLTLVVPTISLSPTVFSLSGTILQVTEGTNAAVDLTTNDVQVTNLSFKNLTRGGTSGNIQISFTLSRTNPSSRNEYDYQKTFISSAEVAW